MRVAILGASGKTGRYLVASLCDAGHETAALGRSAERLAAVDPRAEKRLADIEDAAGLRAALADASHVVSLAHARFAAQVLAALPEHCERVVLTGSTRRFTNLPDTAADGVRAGEAAFSAAKKPGVMLHPSMIYGAPDDRNINRLLRLLRRWPRFLPVLLPLPDGGRHSVQPVFVDDVVAAFVGALTRTEAPGEAIVLAGPEPISYARMIRACGAALGRRVRILPVPVALLGGVARGARRIGLPAPFNEAELRRAAEDKAFDIAPMTARLGVEPRSFEAGLADKISRGWG
ncbi:MAG: NAD(P)H-binding protein [Proteobacteria bacterium]|nr:NAD(P)H-binding protein [Pseudomonadota bacterium]